MHIAHNKTLRKLFAPLIYFTMWLGKNHPTTLVKLRYFARFQTFLNLKNPQTLNEKILWCSLCTDTTLWSKCADKYGVREYLEEKGLKNLLFPLLGVYDKPEDIEWDKLPNEFVIKTTHGSGDIMIVRDKDTTDRKTINEYFTKELSQRFGYLEGSTHYPRIDPKLIVEPLMKNDVESQKYSTSIIDYKFWCFNGKPQFCWVCCNRDKNGTDVMTYDMDWNAHPEYSIFYGEYRHGNVIPKPENFDEMKHICEMLSEDFPVLRCDLYNLGGKVYFGELTFTSLGGLMDFYTPEFLLEMGNKVDVNYKG